MNDLGIFLERLRTFEKVDLLKHFGKSDYIILKWKVYIITDLIQTEQENQLGLNKLFDDSSESFILEKLEQIEDLENRMKKT